MLATTLLATVALALHVPQPGSLRVHPRVAAGPVPRMCAAAGFVTPDTPPLIESECSFDHVPLSIALQTGDFLEADQITRDSLIKLAGEQAVGRGYVYFTEVAKLPEKDLATIERLWLAYSGGKFGYSVQAKELKTKKINGNLEKLFVRIGWMNDQVRPLARLPMHQAPPVREARPSRLPGLTRPARCRYVLQGKLLRWLPEKKSNDFIYELDKVRPPGVPALPSFTACGPNYADAKRKSQKEKRRLCAARLLVGSPHVSPFARALIQAPNGHLPLTNTLRGQQLYSVRHLAVWRCPAMSCAFALMQLRLSPRRAATCCSGVARHHFQAAVTRHGSRIDPAARTLPRPSLIRPPPWLLRTCCATSVGIARSSNSLEERRTPRLSRRGNQWRVR